MMQGTAQATTSAPGGALNWIDPPTVDVGASKAFFVRALETILGGAYAGSSMSGAGIGYLAVPDLSAAIACRTTAGWRALTEILDLPGGIGRIAYMRDAEGGQIGLHQPGQLA